MSDSISCTLARMANTTAEGSAPASSNDNKEDRRAPSSAKNAALPEATSPPSPSTWLAGVVSGTGTFGGCCHAPLRRLLDAITKLRSKLLTTTEASGAPSVAPRELTSMTLVINVATAALCARLLPTTMPWGSIALRRHELNSTHTHTHTRTKDAHNMYPLPEGLRRVT